MSPDGGRAEADVPGRRRGEDRPELLTFPSEDHAFARAVQAGAGNAPRLDTPEELERILRPRFPRVVVRPRALSAEPRATWYVFRDGRVTG